MLTTAARVKEHMGISGEDQDALIANLIKSVSAWIETQTSRHLGVAEYQEKIDGAGTQEIFLSNFPIKKIDKVKMGESEIEDYEVNEQTGELFRAAGWPAGRRNVEVEYEAGYQLPGLQGSGDPAADLPADIELACVRIVARIMERRTAEGITSASPGSISVSFEKDISPDILATVHAYKKIHV